MSFTKRYDTVDAATSAAVHHGWLASLGLPVPDLIAHHPQALDFQRLPGRHARPGDLPALGRLLGQAHAASHRVALHAARLDCDLHVSGVGAVPAFTGDRTVRVRQLLDADAVPGSALTGDQAADIIESAAAEPAAFYKDCNPRNFLITPTSISFVDFDDLTLAPYGYDLAKLIVTTAMTHGSLPDALVGAALNAYNKTAPYPCTPQRLTDWTEIHHILTSPYMGRNGYTHSWHTPRPSERTT
ncbi:phosphotransferase [Streptomyces goshikiensis]|uniref:phosphotransferase n=1 Tax=Streptomyces goshikiensis TaxID=1942 RepID=UPI00364FE8BE